VNGKDAKAIAEILAINVADDDFCQGMFKIDGRIEEHYLEMREVVGDLRKVNAHYHRQMRDQHGPDWESTATKAEKAAGLEVSRKLIYGESYDPNLFSEEGAR
jgi:hypothetical protein